MKLHVLQTIKRIYRIPGGQPVYRLVLSCNHRRTVTRSQIDREQLFVRKTESSARSAHKSKEETQRAYIEALISRSMAKNMKRIFTLLILGTVLGASGASLSAQSAITNDLTGGMTNGRFWIDIVWHSQALAWRTPF
jgi:hypothetical protein